jgi:hypothetical protein
MISTIRTVLISAFTSLIVCTLFVTTQGLAADKSYNDKMLIENNTQKIAVGRPASIIQPYIDKCNNSTTIDKQQCIKTVNSYNSVYSSAISKCLKLKDKIKCNKKAETDLYKKLNKIDFRGDPKKAKPGILSKNKNTIQNIAGKFFGPDPKTPAPSDNGTKGGGSRKTTKIATKLTSPKECGGTLCTPSTGNGGSSRLYDDSNNKTIN